MGENTEIESHIRLIVENGTPEELLSALNEYSGRNETVIVLALASRGKAADLLQGLDIIGGENEAVLVKAIAELGDPDALLKALALVSDDKGVLARAVVQCGNADDWMRACLEADSHRSIMIDKLIEEDAVHQLQEILTALEGQKRLLNTIHVCTAGVSYLVAKLLSSLPMMTGLGTKELSEDIRQIKRALGQI